MIVIGISLLVSIGLQVEIFFSGSSLSTINALDLINC